MALTLQLKGAAPKEMFRSLPGATPPLTMSNLTTALDFLWYPAAIHSVSTLLPVKTMRYAPRTCLTRSEAKKPSAVTQFGIYNARRVGQHPVQLHILIRSNMFECAEMRGEPISAVLISLNAS